MRVSSKQRYLKFLNLDFRFHVCARSATARRHGNDAPSVSLSFLPACGRQAEAGIQEELEINSQIFSLSA